MPVTASVYIVAVSAAVMYWVLYLPPVASSMEEMISDYTYRVFCQGLLIMVVVFLVYAALPSK